MPGNVELIRCLSREDMSKDYEFGYVFDVFKKTIYLLTTLQTKRIMN